MQRTLMVVLVSAAAAFAQTAPTPPAPAELKTYLNLTDSQITGLRAVQTQLQNAVNSLRTQVQTKQTDLDAKLAAGTTDAAALGRLLLEIQALRKQLDTQSSSFRAQAQNLLTAEQKTKLKALDDAAKLQPAIGQAIGLLLLAPPTSSTVPGGPGPGGFGGRSGPRGMGGPGGPGFGPMGFGPPPR
jgi:Spy/CpxP family protein refolding chaperone